MAVKTVLDIIENLTSGDYKITNKRVHDILHSTDIIEVRSEDGYTAILCNRKGDPAKIRRWCDPILVKKMSATWAKKNGAQYAVQMQ
jgi:hypothetical protein